MADNAQKAVVVKAPAVLAPGDDDSDTPHGTFDVILSTPTEDRDGEQVKTEEWQQPLPDHITFDVDHGMSVEKTVGSGRPFINADGDMQVKGTYASTPLAQMTRTLVNEGHIRATSVTFLRKTIPGEKGAKRTVRELLNGAFVPVPANPEAMVLASKSALDNQRLHDLAVSNGAACKTHEHSTAPTDPGTPAAAPAPAPSPAEVDAVLAVARVTAEISDLL